MELGNGTTSDDPQDIDVPLLLFLVDRLSNLTSPTNVSLFPEDLEGVATSIADVVDLLSNNSEPLSRENAEEVL